MPSFDSARFFFSLAGALRSGEWTPAGLRTAFELTATDRLIRVPGLFNRLLAKFPRTPEYNPLLWFLWDDRGLNRALSRPLVHRRRTRPEMSGRPAGLGSLALPTITTEAGLAEWLGVRPGRLRWWADLAGRNRKHPPGPYRTYRYRWVPKPGGRARLLEIPINGLKRLQRLILEGILNPIPPHPAVHGFRTGRSAITNATEHCDRDVVVKFDLTDFFPSVPATRVCRIFRTVGYPELVARLLTGICTTCLPVDVWDARPIPATDGSDHAARLRLTDRHLPQGAPTSPALANLAAHRLDRRLARLATWVQATYTRYADDLTLSGGPELLRSIKRLVPVVSAIAADEGFRLNPDKTRIMRRGNRQMVTGVVVNAHPNTPRAEFDRLKAILTNCVRHGPAGQNRDDHADFRAHLMGRIAHITAVNPARGHRLRAIFDQIAWVAGEPGA